MDKGTEIFKIVMALLISTVTALSIAVAIRIAVYDELNDPNRTHYITRVDESLWHGEVYEKEFIPAHRERRTRTEMQTVTGICPATGNAVVNVFPVIIAYYVDIPDTFMLRIVVIDTERLVRFTNEITVSENIFDCYEIGDIFGERQNPTNLRKVYSYEKQRLTI